MVVGIANSCWPLRGRHDELRRDAILVEPILPSIFIPNVLLLGLWNLLDIRRTGNDDEVPLQPKSIGAFQDAAVRLILRTALTAGSVRRLVPLSSSTMVR